MPPISAPYRVALLGFSDFEHSALVSSLRLATRRLPRYECAASMADCHFVVVDAEQADTLAAVTAAGKLMQTLFIGSQAPAGSNAWMARPIDPLQVLRALDRLVTMQAPSGTNAPNTPAKPLAAAAPGALATYPRALLVDDSEIALRFLETRLQRRQLFTERATQSGKAIEMLSQRTFDIVFVDVELGLGSDLDGLALCQHIKRQHHAARHAAAPVVVMVSAHHSELDRARGALAGCDAYLGKPLDEDLLDRLLALHRLSPGATAQTAG